MPTGISRQSGATYEKKQDYFFTKEIHSYNLTTSKRARTIVWYNSSYNNHVIIS